MPNLSEPDDLGQLRASWPQAVSSLSSPEFRLLLLGQAVALQGTWIQSTAQRWLVLELSNSPLVLGIFGAVAALPLLLFSFWGGWLADRLKRTTVLITAQTIILLQAVIFGFLVQKRLITVEEAAALAFVLGTGMAFEVPARQALVFDLVGRWKITNALALHSTAFNTARFAGPAIAGLLMDAGLLYLCFYLKAASAAIILLVLFILRLAGKADENAKSHAGAQTRFGQTLKEMFVFLRDNRLVRTILLVVVAFSICLLPYTVLLPSFGRDLLGLGAREYGFLCAANGLGALTGALFVAALGHKGDRRTWWKTGIVLFPIFILGFSATTTYVQACLLLFGAGFTMVITNTSIITLLQLSARDSQRGKVMGLFTMSFMGLFPLGSLLQGAMGQVEGVRTTIAIMSMVALMIVFRALFVLSRHDHIRE